MLNIISNLNRNQNILKTLWLNTDIVEVWKRIYMFEKFGNVTPTIKISLKNTKTANISILFNPITSTR